MQAYEDSNHPSNKIRPRTVCWGCGNKGCVGKHWGNWCFACNVARIKRITGQLRELSGTGTINGINCRVEQ